MLNSKLTSVIFAGEAWALIRGILFTTKRYAANSVLFVKSVGDN